MRTNTVGAARCLGNSHIVVDSGCPLGQGRKGHVLPHRRASPGIGGGISLVHVVRRDSAIKLAISITPIGIAELVRVVHNSHRAADQDIVLSGFTCIFGDGIVRGAAKAVALGGTAFARRGGRRGMNQRRRRRRPKDVLHQGPEGNLAREFLIARQPPWHLDGLPQPGVIFDKVVRVGLGIVGERIVARIGMIIPRRAQGRAGLGAPNPPIGKVRVFKGAPTGIPHQDRIVAGCQTGRRRVGAARAGQADLIVVHDALVRRTAVIGRRRNAQECGVLQIPAGRRSNLAPIALARISTGRIVGVKASALTHQTYPHRQGVIVNVNGGVQILVPLLAGEPLNTLGVIRTSVHPGSQDKRTAWVCILAGHQANCGPTVGMIHRSDDLEFDVKVSLDLVIEKSKVIVPMRYALSIGGNDELVACHRVPAVDAGRNVVQGPERLNVPAKRVGQDGKTARIYFDRSGDVVGLHRLCHVIGGIHLSPHLVLPTAPERQVIGNHHRRRGGARGANLGQPLLADARQSQPWLSIGVNVDIYIKVGVRHTAGIVVDNCQRQYDRLVRLDAIVRQIDLSYL